MAIVIGALIAFLLPSAFIDDIDKFNPVDGRKHFETLLLVENILIFLCCMPGLIFIRN